MSSNDATDRSAHELGFFGRYLTVWVILCILAGIGLGRVALGVGRLPVPWQALVLSIGIYVALPLVAGYFVRRRLVSTKGISWFRERFLPILSPHDDPA